MRPLPLQSIVGIPTRAATVGKKADRNGRPRCLLALWWLACLALLMSPIAQGSVRGETAFVDQLNNLVKTHEGTVAVSIRHLPTGESYQFQGDKPMPTASLIKFPVMIALYDAVARQEADLASMIELQESDLVPGSGILTGNILPGTRLTVKNALQLMIVHSDNSATNLVIDQMGIPATADLMKKLGCPNTKLHAKVYRHDTSIFPERSKQFGLGSTTANEMISLLTRMDKGQLISPEASAEMLGWMLQCGDRGMLARELPKSVKLAHKTGAVSNTRTDAGIMESDSGRIAICVLTTDNKDQSWSNDNAAQVLGGRIAKIALDHFCPEVKEKEDGPTVLKVGSNGDLVETLQRTLNARLKPPGQLSVDGDFGPATEGAVKQFQVQAGLAETGHVDAATWKALGKLITQDDPVPDPAEVNSEVLAVEPLPALDGPPAVTCNAWAIGDAATGELLWGKNAAQRLHPASTTKIMTGYLVTRAAAKDPTIWKETVTFSNRADATGGSSARVKAGEQLPVSELLYGLLLPSGNDASVSLAEHLGKRAYPSPPTRPVSEDPLVQFIDAMNEMATQLGMSETHFENTHGLTHEAHLTSARDLLKLAYVAMEEDEFRQRTSARQRGCTVQSNSGYARNVLWKNTNRLLKFAGMDGVKTGTTSAAGACLVSRGHREGRGLIVVVLGAPTTDCRYVDSQNLYQWGFRQLARSKP